MRLGQPNQSKSVPKMLALVLLATVCLILAGCHLWYQDMKGFLEYWTGTVSIGDVSWSVRPASQKDSSGVDTISANATITASVDIINPDGYPLDGGIGSASDTLRSVRISGDAGSAARVRARVSSSSATGMEIEIAPLSMVPTPESLKLEHKDFTVEFAPTRSENGMQSDTTRSLTLRYNTPPRMPLAVIKDSSGSYRWPTNGDRWDVSQGELYFAWPQDKTKSGGGAPSHPDYVERFYIEDDGTDSDWYEEEYYKDPLGATLTGNDGTVYNIYWYLPTGTTVTVYAEDGTGVRGAGITSGALHGITLKGNGGSFGSSDTVTIYRTLGAVLGGGDLDIPTRSGYYLSGWSLSPSGAPLEFPYTVSAPVTLYALWTAGTSDGGAPPAPSVTDPHVMYVDPAAGNDTSDGLSAATALKTLQAAVSKVVAANDGSPYTINLMGDIDDSGSPSYSSATNNSLVSVVPGKALSLTIKSDTGGASRTVDAGRTANRTGRVFYVGADATVTLQDVVVTGGYSTESGGGIHIAGGAVILGGSAVVRANEALNGGGVSVSGGTLSMRGGEISGNTATYDGGGVYVASTGAVGMAGGAIGVSGSPNTADNGGGIAVNDGIVVIVTAGNVSYNEATSNGGGIYILGGDVTLQGGASVANNQASTGGGIAVNGGMIVTAGNVSYNVATSNGGGIYLLNGTASIQGGTVSYNTAASGGGVYTTTTPTLEMTGGDISSNSVTTGKGGAINLSGTLTMTGGTISGNGSQGIYANLAQAINLGGSAVIAADNDIQLGNGKTITVTSSLTGSTPVATISPFNYTVGTPVLSAGSGVTLANEADKFAVVPDSTSPVVQYFVDNNGTLQQQP